MYRFFRFLIKHKKSVIIFYSVLAVLMAILSRRVKVNNDLADYLPKDSDSTIAIDVMEKQFDEELPNLQVMVKDISLKEASELVSVYEKIDGVIAVSWAETMTSDFISMPVEMLPDSTLSKYYKDGNALYTLTVDQNKELDTLDEIRNAAGKETVVSGSFADEKIAQGTAPREIMITVVIAISFAMCLLLLSMDSWLEPFILLLCLIIGVIINAGTNIIFGTISSMTNTAASVLQMGVSIDYFIFILHRFRENREEIMNSTDLEDSSRKKSEEAMVKSMVQSFSSILSSSLTTIIGFVALMFMRYRIGLDMGLVLSKGVATSLLTAFTLLPCMTLILEKAVEKTRHKAIISSASGLAKLSKRIHIPLMIIFVLLIFPALYMQLHNKYYYGTSHMYKDTHSVAVEAAEIKRIFGENNTMVLLVPKGQTASENMLIKELKSMEEMKSVTSYSELFGLTIPEELLPKEYISLLHSDEYSRIVMELSLGTEDEETFEKIDEIKEKASAYYGEEFHLIGGSVSTYDLKNVISADSIKVNMIAIGAVFLVLLLSFRSLIIPVMLTLSIEGAIWITMAVPYITGSHLFYIGYLIVSSVLLGSTVDYAILLTNRYREIRKDNMELDKREAVQRAISISAVSIMSSGLILSVAGFLLNLICVNQVTAQLGRNLFRGTVMAMMVVIFVLPGLLITLDRFIIRKRT
ncbi:MAG: MMPL family transporter [Eubacterium sp.]|nr:MMPL family transporter [Eubacterium sp.]